MFHKYLAKNVPVCMKKKSCNIKKNSNPLLKYITKNKEWVASADMFVI
jgi:hypothetical protein